MAEKYNQPSVSVIVPGLNEAGNIEKAISVIIEALKKQKIDDYEILLIDDGSTDGMDKIVDRMAAENDRLRPFHNPIPKGLGYNFRTGVFLAGKNYVWLTIPLRPRISLKLFPPSRR